MMELVLGTETPEEQAAIRMQAIQRGNIARRGQPGTAAAGRHSREEAAATRMQAMHRGNAVRRKWTDGGQ